MKNRTLVEQWLSRALSNLDRARAGKVRDTILYEDLCFDCQQAVEKSLKALLVANDKGESAYPSYRSPARNS
jgi:HEPN domain-containing protein